MQHPENEQASAGSRLHALRQAHAAKRGDLYARLSVWASLAAASAGASGVWRAPWVDMPSMSAPILAVFAVTTGMVWLAGVLPLVGAQEAHASLRWWAPGAWAFVHAAWPGTAGLAVAHAAGASAQGLATQAAWALAALCLVVAAVACLTRAGVALTMRPPWPRGVLLPAGFQGLRAGTVWVALLATAILNLLTVQGSARLLERAGASWPAPPAATPNPPASTQSPTLKNPT